MPTVIALDVSLSMSQPVVLPDVTEEYQRKHLANHGINAFLDYLSSFYKLEFVSLIAFSYLWEQLSAFTRDYSLIRAALNKVEAFSKTCIETALNGIKTVISDEWNHSSCQPWCRGWVLDVGEQGGELFTLDGPISFKSVEDAFIRLAEKYYSPFCGTLSCGNFVCPVHLFPKPEPYIRQMDDGLETHTVTDKLEIIGFIDIKDIGSPPTVARHLVLPKSTKDRGAADKDKENKSGKSEEEDETLDEGKTPSFTVLLHGSLKVESMVAVTRVQEDWYGMIYSWADSKKKSNLMLALFEPGQNAIPWIGPFDNLTSCKEYLPEVIYSDEEKKSPFPVRPTDKRSYAQSCVVWIKPSGLQSDIQKVLRHARKLPDKLQQFYKELNRTRRAALSFGFLELLEAMAAMLERECRLLPGTAHPDAALQLTHAASALRSEVARDVTKTIMALHTNFASGSSA
ncbi:unnamed protein product [Candidula unifasciata]|uniref:Integrator complex subunit 14 n=1 Tax=Candidula unifasciata TaxID=100452 RepID=A0A8S3YBG8_9EUPU|nr:unnamed protein product [Candidula unifasciata]